MGLFLLILQRTHCDSLNSSFILINMGSFSLIMTVTCIAYFHVLDFAFVMSFVSNKNPRPILLLRELGHKEAILYSRSHSNWLDQF